MADNWGEPAAGNGGARTPSPSRNRQRSRSPDRRMDTSDDRGRSNGGGGQNPGNNLHVSGLASRVEERDLEELFSKHGRVQKAQVMRDPHTKDPRGFGFVTMETPEEAEAAMSALNATELQGKMMSVERARRGRARTPTPGAYHGPPKRDFPPRDEGRRYDDRYDDRRDYGRRDYYDDRRGGGGGYDDRRGGYDDRRDSRRDDRGYGSSYAVPMRDDRRGGDDRGGRYDDRSR